MKNNKNKKIQKIENNSLLVPFLLSAVSSDVEFCSGIEMLTFTEPSLMIVSAGNVVVIDDTRRSLLYDGKTKS